MPSSMAAQFAGHTGRADDATAAQRHLEAHGAANGVVHDCRASRQHGLFQVGGIELQVAFAAPLPQVRHRLRMLQLSGTPATAAMTSAVRSSMVGPSPPLTMTRSAAAIIAASSALSSGAVVTHGDLAVHTDAHLGQALRNQGGVGVHGVAAHDLVASEQQLYLQW